MLLNNNNNEAVVAGQQQQVVFRQSRPAKPSRNNNNKKSSAGGGTSAARNSWSFQTPETLLVQAGINTKVENIYADPETLMMLNGNNTNSEMKSVSRSRLRQRSVSNLTAASLAGTRANREHSSNRNAHQQNGTVSAKGVDYIRMRPAAVEPPQQIIQDRSEYGNPDGSSAHSTAERDAAAGLTCSNNKEVYEVIHQNQANHLIQSSEGEAIPTLLVRSVSGQHTNVVPTTRGSPREVAVPAVRKPHTAAASSGPIKTEWTFLPSPTAPPTDPPSESSTVRKGLVWMMRDRLFSRYHERFCILTRNYLHCFKKGTEGSLTHMGNFLFKVSLADVMAVQWLDKRGTAIVCLTLAKEGRLLVKTSLDLQGWFEDFQSCVKETIGRRQTLLLAPKNSSGSAETPSPPISARHRQQYVVQPVVRDRSLAARNRSTNRYSLMSDHEVKMTGMSATSGAAPEGSDNGNPSGILAGQPLSLCYTVPAQMTSSTPPPPPTTTTQAGPPPVPVPYRERSVSFDRSRASKAERDAKRRSYFPSNHVTQV